jgi:hypothetical protein
VGVWKWQDKKRIENTLNKNKTFRSSQSDKSGSSEDFKKKMDEKRMTTKMIVLTV